ncbi:MAG: acyl-CoA dehydrogenase [Gammaproteobacteria bacterium]|nr:acyl-CoA dehydrogenase [Gammaproteobacteria bacterium]
MRWRSPRGEDEAFREEVRDFLDAHLTPALKAAAARQTTVFPDRDVALQWQAVLQAAKGWAAPAWPKAFGGPGFSANQRYIFNQECARAGAPGLIPLGLRMLAPVLFRYGTPEQQAHYLPKILSGEHYWCQGYSEPGSGSDLSSLQTTAERDGDVYRVNGTKLWTTHGHFADHIFCLVRTDRQARPQKGISFLLIPMNTAGISVKPVITLAGDHEVNQVFFDDVVVPEANRVGPENEGWTVLDHTRALASLTREDGTSVLEQPEIANRLAALGVRLDAFELSELRTLAGLAEGGSPGPESSLAKNLSVRLEQDINTLALEVSAYYGLAQQPRGLASNEEPLGPEAGVAVTGRYLNSRAASIFGGSEEVQKNIIAKAVLGL